MLAFLVFFDSMNRSAKKEKDMSGGSYKIGYCNSCRRNVQHFRGRKSAAARILDISSLFMLNFGPWYCSHCEIRTRSLPWVRRRHPTYNRVADRLDESTPRIGNFIRSDDSLVMRQKRTGRYSRKFREGVVLRLTSGKTSISQLKSDLDVTERDLMAWVAEVIEAREIRIAELNSHLKSYTRVAADLIAIDEKHFEFDESENLIEGRFERRQQSGSKMTG